MSYKSILVHASPLLAHAGRLRCAASLADAFGATVIGLGVEAVAPQGVSAGTGYDAGEAAWLETRYDQLKENMLVAEARLHDALTGRPHKWRSSLGMPTDTMAQMARAADLIVVGGEKQRSNFDPYLAVDIGGLILNAGRPVLLCPPQIDGALPRSVLVAWKDTRESRRALADALPFLQLATEVTVLEVCAKDEQDHATARVADVASALQRHGVTARPRTALRQGASAGAIFEQADNMGAGLIVAGGYGHSRFDEWVFGGVTRALLDQEQRFVLFSH